MEGAFGFGSWLLAFLIVSSALFESPESREIGQAKTLTTASPSHDQKQGKPQRPQRAHRKSGRKSKSKTFAADDADEAG
jgi:hypothetical protein